MFRRDDAIPYYVEGPHFRGGDTQGCTATGVRKCVLHLGRRMRDPVAVVSAIIAVIEIIHVGGTAVDRKKGCRGAGTARVCGGGVGGIAAGDGAVPAKEALGPGHRRSRSAIERGAQTKNLVD